MRHLAPATLATLALLAALALLYLLVADPHPGARAQAVVHYPAGWNLVAGPEGATLSGTLGPLYTLQGTDTTYETLPSDAPIHACWGYWAYFPAGGTQSGGYASGTCSVPLIVGRTTMIGNPALSGEAITSGVDTLSIYDPDTGYTRDRPIPPGQGAFVTGLGVAEIAVPGFARPVPVSSITALPAFIVTPGPFGITPTPGPRSPSATPAPGIVFAPVASPTYVVPTVITPTSPFTAPPVLTLVATPVVPGLATPVPTPPVTPYPIPQP